MLRDLRYTSRALLKRRSLVAVAVVCLALGVGINTTVFSIVDAILVRALPFRDASRLVAIYAAQPSAGIDRTSSSYLDWQDWIPRASSIDASVAFSSKNVAVSDGRESDRQEAAAVTWDVFPFLGVDPLIGRAFTSSEDQPGAVPVMLISHGLWQRRFGEDRGVLGRTLLIDGKAHTIIGVMPPRFRFPQTAELWFPLRSYTRGADLQSRTHRSLSIFGRLRPGSTSADAQREIGAAAAQLAGAYVEDKNWTVVVRPARDFYVGDDARLMLWTWLAAVWLVLAIACVNVANLLVVHATTRRVEFGVRAALGAGRGPIVRLLLLEGVLLSLTSVPAGLAVAAAGLRIFNHALPAELGVPYVWDWSLNLRGVAYAAGVALCSAVVFSCAPILQVGRDPHDALKAGGRGAARGADRLWLRHTLVVAEIALSVVLVVSAALFIRSLTNLQRGQTGYDPHGLLLMRVSLVGLKYIDPRAQIQRAEDLVQRMEALPGVAAAMASSMTPYDTRGSDKAIRPVGVTYPKDEEPHAQFFGVTAHAFATLQLAILSGRDFTSGEAERATPVAIVNQVVAERLWPGARDVIGQQFETIELGGSRQFTVIGTISRMSLATVREAPEPYIFVPYPVLPDGDVGLTIRVRGREPGGLASAARQQVRAADPMISISDVMTGDVARANDYWADSLFSVMFSLFGSVAVVLGAIGVYGVVSYSVSQRTPEIGVRMALGATPAGIASLILRQVATLAGLGIVAGVGAGFLATRVLSSFLYKVGAADPVSFVGAAIFLALVALLASLPPVRRATRVDPSAALRSE